MSGVKHLLDREPMSVLIGERLLQTDRFAARNAYRAFFTLVPNLRPFFDVVREEGGQDLVSAVWFRIWSNIEAEKQLGIATTAQALFTIPHMYDRPFTLKLPHHTSLIDDLTTCIELLDKLIQAANLPNGKT